MTTPQVVQMSVTVNNSAIQDYIHLDNHTQPTYIVWNNSWVQAFHSFFFVVLIYRRTAHLLKEAVQQWHHLIWTWQALQ